MGNQKSKTLPVNNPRAQGYLMAAAGVGILSADAILVRLADVSAASAAFWRNILIGLALTGFLVATRRLGEFVTLRHCGMVAFGISFIYGINNLLFVFSVSLTSVANTIVILAATPLFAAVFSRILLKESTSPSTLLAVFVAMGGVAIVVSDELSGDGLKGNLLALVLATSTGWLLTMLRARPELPRAPAIAIGAAASAMLITPWAFTAAIGVSSTLYLLLAGGLVKPLASILTLSAPRKITAAEVGLLLLLEVILSPLWAWLFLEEALTYRTLFGGVIISAAVVFHLWTSLTAETQTQQAAQQHHS